MNDKELAAKIIELAGGKENINKAIHCITRLRLYISDESKFDKEGILKETGLQTIINGGQHQVVIGPGKVNRIYDEVIELTGLTSFEEVDADNGADIKDVGNEFKEKQNLFNAFLAFISSIFQPILGILAASGMIKGLTAMLVAFGVVNATSTTYQLLDSIGNTFMIALPVFVGFYSMKAFKGTPMIGLTLGLILISPAITAFASSDNVSVLFDGTIFQANVKATFFGLPIVITGMGYQYSVVPVIFICWVAAKIEKGMKKISPDALSLFLVPFVTIIVASIVGLLLLGPIFGILTSLLSAGFAALIQAAPIVYGIVLGGVWQVLVLFGLHWALVPFAYLQLEQLGAGTIDKMFILVSVAAVCFSCTGAVLGVIIKDKSKVTNSIAIPALVTSIFGISEPSIYGVTIPRKTPFIATLIGGAVSGGYLMATNTGTYTNGGLGLFNIPSYFNPKVTQIGQQADVFNFLIAVVIAFVVSLIVTIFIYKKKEEL